MLRSGCEDEGEGDRVNDGSLAWSTSMTPRS
jgi:hypothetical protein